jgi:hypothetical protein
MDLNRLTSVAIFVLFATRSSHAFNPALMGHAGSGGGLAVAYSFSEGTGTTTSDRSGSGNTLTLQSGVTWTASGRTGNAVVVGSGGSLTGSASPLLASVTKALTMMAWVYPTSDPGGNEVMVLSYYNAGYPYGLEAFDYSASVGYPSCYVAGGSGYVAGLAKIPLNTWSHLACTYDGANVRLYVNGALVNSTAFTSAINSSSAVLYVGDDPGPGDVSFIGRIDDARIFVRTLSTPEVVVMMNMPVAQ